ncbi:hypothetical protein [Nocardia sp. NPDC051463]|uniref:WXG100-like domain-containing protein n=1 Tax=Nocardia sp. NPDC051463 TaxID=3154845 RepID=UPI003430D787
MAIEIPSEVVFFLNMVGVPYPDINEDDVKALAEHVRTFATSVQDTHESASGVVKDMGSVYSGYSYSALVSTWARMSTTHMADLDRACHFVAKALEIAAEVITVVKVVVLAELAALAASYIAVMFTPGLQPMAAPIGMSARNICSQMQQMLVGYIVAEVIGKAIEPLEKTIEDMIKGVVYDAASNLLGVPADAVSETLSIDPDEVQRYAKVLDEHADDIMKHAATFAANVAPLDFTTPARFDQTPNSTTPEHRVTPSTSIGPADTGLLSRPNTGYESGTGYESRKGFESGNGYESRPAATALQALQASDRPAPNVNDASDERSATGAQGPRTGDSAQPAPEAAQSGGAPAQASSAPSRLGGMPGDALPVGDAERGDGGRNNVTNPAVSALADTGAAGGRAGAPAVELDHATNSSGPAQTPVVADSSGAALGGHTPSTGHGADQPHAASDSAPVGGAPSSPPAGRGAAGGAATPWGRAKPSKAKASKSSKPRRPKRIRPTAAASSADRKPGETPWSKVGRTPDVAATVFAPKVSEPSPQSHPEHAAQQDRDREDPKKVATPGNTPVTPRVSAPTVTAPEVDIADLRRPGV